MKKPPVLTPVIAVLLLGGCAVGNNETQDPDVRIAEMKQVAQDAESKVTALLPARETTEIQQLKEGSFLPCNGGFVWSGNTKVSLAEGVEGKTAQEAIASKAGEVGYTVKRDRLLRGGTRYELMSAAGVRLLVTVYESGHLIDIDSFSPCSSFPDDYNPPEVY